MSNENVTLPLHPSRRSALSIPKIHEEHRLERAPEEKPAAVPPKAARPKVCIEYQAPHWYICVKTPSGKWEALCDPHKFITLQDAFGETINRKPAIKTYPTYQQAYNALETQVPHHRLTKRSILFSSLGSILNPFGQ